MEIIHMSTIPLSVECTHPLSTEKKCEQTRCFTSHMLQLDPLRMLKEYPSFLLCLFLISTWIGSWVGWHLSVIKPIVWRSSLATPRMWNTSTVSFWSVKSFAWTHKTGVRLNFVYLIRSGGVWLWKSQHTSLPSILNNKSLKINTVSFSQLRTEVNAILQLYPG